MSIKKPIKKCPKCGIKIKRNSITCRKHVDYSKTRNTRTKRLVASNKKHIEKNHYCWKGDNVGYSALHKWLRKKFGKPDRCQNALCDGKSNCYEWSNITGIYNRNIKNYVMLCKGCHVRLDRWNQQIIILKDE